MKQNILLTGVTGFLGSVLLNELLDHGYSVVGIKRSSSSLLRINNVVTNPSLMLFDIDKSDPSEIFQNINIDAIIHTATEYGRSDQPVYKILEANLILPIRLAELGIRHGTELFINSDSYFNKNNYSYTHLLNYSLSKKSLLTWLINMANQIKVINASIEHMYGPFDASTKFVEHAIRSIAIEKIHHIPLTHGHQRRDFIHVYDVASAFLKLLDYGFNNKLNYKSIEIGTGKSTQVRDFINSIKEISRSRTLLGFGDLPYRSDEIMESFAINTELRQIGWEPKINIQNGLSSIINKYQ